RPEWEQKQLEGIFRLVVDACKNDTPGFLQRSMARYPDLLQPLAKFELRFHTNSASRWRGNIDHVPSMLNKVNLVEYAILMDAPRVAQLLLAHRTPICTGTE